MKILPIITIWLISSSAFTECTKAQESAEIDLTVIRGLKSVDTSTNHGLMDRIAINAPAEIQGLPIVAMELTRGEVAELWIPLAYTIAGGRAATAITGFPSAIQNFEISIYYKNGVCKKSIQRML